MGMPKGSPRPPGAGRKKGTCNRQTADVRARLTALGCDPIAGLARIADEAAGRDDPAERKLAAWCYGELASYIEPKRKAVEHSGEIKTVLPCVPIPGPAPPPVPA